MNSRPQRTSWTGRHFPAHHAPHAGVVHPHAEQVAAKPLVVMKFGGTSVGDAAAIARVVEIVRAGASERRVAVVVSAMSGVTNQLVEAAVQSEAGMNVAVASLLEGVRGRHAAAIDALIHSATERAQLAARMNAMFQELDRLCQGTSLLRELTARSRDAISGMGERLCAPIVAAALAERGVASVAIESTQLVVTDSCHGGAEPETNLTRERCAARLHPLLEQNIVPVITGFIGATSDGVLTTLGRGGSDYSATIVAAALDADEVIIWTDVDGMHTADPRLVAEGCPIPEISYREASELAYFGAKVLHPKTLRAVTQLGIRLWIRNTFAPERYGTRITPTGADSDAAVTALTAMSDVVLIHIGGPGMSGATDVLGRVFRSTAAVRAEVLLLSQSSSQNDLCLVIPAGLAARTAQALRQEFVPELAQAKTEHIAVDGNVAMVSVVGRRLRGGAGGSVIGRSCSALDRESVSVIAIAQGSAEGTLSFVVARPDMQAALVSLHREFQPEFQPSELRLAEPTAPPPCYESLPSNRMANQGE